MGALGARKEDELMRIDGMPLDNECDIGEGRVVDHRLKVTREGEHRRRGRLLQGGEQSSQSVREGGGRREIWSEIAHLQGELEAIIKVASAIVAAEDKE